MPLLIDASEAQLATLMEAPRARRATVRAVADLQGVVGRQVKQALGSAPTVLQGEPAARLLAKLIAAVDAAAGRWAGLYSSIQWLWLLRRIPSHIFEGSLDTTLPYDLALATVLSARSPSAGGRRLKGDQLAYALKDADAERVWRYCAGIRYLSHLHQTYRWANKGAPVQFSLHVPPQAQPSQELRVAVELFDDRMASSSSFLAHAGNIAMPGRDRKWEVTAILQVEPVSMTVPDLPGPPALNSDVTARYILRAVDLEPFIKVLLDEPSAKHLETAKEVASLCCLMAVVYHLLCEHRMVAGVLQRGYLLWGHNRLALALERAFAQLPATFAELASWSGITSATKWIDHLQRMEGSSWPLIAGPVLRSDGTLALLDFYFASTRLSTLISEFGREGAPANTRANLFELRVQAAIDASPWRPPEVLRRARGKALRIDGQHFTDIDAIGAKDDRLLLVSCKSTLYSPQYDAGDYRAVRNRESLLSIAISDWDQKIMALRSSPRGENFDFSGFTEITGVVCTPLPVYTRLMPVARMASESLTPSCSFHELEVWLGKESIEIETD